MISQLFILSNRGDVLTNRDFRNDLIKETPEIFFRNVTLKQTTPEPIFNIEGINYIFLKRHSIYIVATTRFPKSPLLIIELLIQVANVIQDFCGNLTEESIRKNFVLIYEIIDEMFDFGYPQYTNTGKVEPYVISQPLTSTGLKLPSLSFLDRNHKKAEETHIPITEANKRNEIFVDVIENLHVIFDSKNLVIQSFIDGIIKMKSFLSGVPMIKTNFNQDCYFDDYSFHECVDYQDFKFNQKLTITPPKGMFTMMSYRISKEPEYPFKIYPTLQQESTYKVVLSIRMICNLPNGIQGKQISLTFAVPKNTTSIYNTCQMKEDQFKAQFLDNEKKVEWYFPVINGGQTYDLTTKIILNEEVSMYQIRKELGPIKMNFEINQKKSSPIQIKSLTISGTEQENPGKWVRYITTSNSYVIRI